MSADPFRDAADPTIPHHLDEYIREYLATGYTEAEVVDALIHWRAQFPGGPTLAAKRLLTIRVATLAGTKPKRTRSRRPPGRPAWTPDLVGDRIRDARREAGAVGEDPPEVWADHFRLLNGSTTADPRYIRRLMSRHGVV